MAVGKVKKTGPGEGKDGGPKKEKGENKGKARKKDKMDPPR